MGQLGVARDSVDTDEWSQPETGVSIARYLVLREGRLGIYMGIVTYQTLSKCCIVLSQDRPPPLLPRAGGPRQLRV